jgi:hypothetical protein
MAMQPNYIDLGLSSPMSAEVRDLIEHLLIEDLKLYGVDQDNLRFDWSDSCV